MAFNSKNFSVMAYANGFTLWNYQTPDTLETVTASGYFNEASAFARKGDMILTVANNSAAVGAGNSGRFRHCRRFGYRCRRHSSGQIFGRRSRIGKITALLANDTGRNRFDGSSFLWRIKMAYTDISICSNALLKIGAESITSFLDGTAEAEVAANLYPMIRDGLLASYPWSFAVGQKSLPRLAGVPLADYSYAYRLPNDFCAYFRRQRPQRPRHRIPYCGKSACIPARRKSI